MYKKKLFYILIFIININPLYSNNNNFNINIGLAYNSKKNLDEQSNYKFNNKIGVNYNLKDISSQFFINLDENNQTNFDNSFIKYEKGITKFNIGKIKRNWSFSKKSSLILSENARPVDAVSVTLSNELNLKWLPPTAHWSIETFNGSTKKSNYGQNSMLFGSRIIFSPIKRLSFELLQTSQWKNESSKTNLSTLGSILFGNTNEGSNSSINKMAGYGASYTIPKGQSIYRIYGQAIGEDEAGALPMCLAWLAGIELQSPKIKYPTTTTIELIDTRVKTSSNGNCGKNTMYNNNTFDYVNYDSVLGASIDTEGTSFELSGHTELNKNLSINYSTKYYVINDKNYSNHRLSSKRSTGSMISFGLSWVKNNFDISSFVGYQSLNLDKARIKSGFLLNLYTKYSF